MGTAEVGTEADAVGIPEVDGVGTTGLVVGSVAAIASSAEVAGTNRTMPAPSGGTDTTVHPGPPASSGVHVVTGSLPMMTCTLM